MIAHFHSDPNSYPLEFAKITLARSPKAADVSHRTLYKLAQQLETADQQ